MERLILENSLRAGLERGEFALFYQPQIALATGRIAGAEALIRWWHPKLGVVQPDRFIPVAEETGLIIDIGDWVLRSACRQNKLWQQQGLPHIPVSVNVAARQCRPEFAVSVRDALAETGLEARYLELELTETTLMGDVGEVLHKLKALGLDCRSTTSASAIPA
jgi:EAL domain-containing protein (putative c-di-GMP-specific phosphodiesterase class I)